MQTYCLSCRKYSDNVDSKKVVLTNKVIREASKCANCVAKKSRFFFKKRLIKNSWDKIDPKLSIY